MISKGGKLLLMISPLVGAGVAWFASEKSIKKAQKELEKTAQKQEQFESYLNELQLSVDKLGDLNAYLNDLNSSIDSAMTENGEVDQEKLNEVLTELFKKYDIPDIDIESDTLDFD